MFIEIYAQEKLREMKDARPQTEMRRGHADPNAEVPRTGVGLVHEVFRRIAEGEHPERRTTERRPKPRWSFAR